MIGPDNRPGSVSSLEFQPWKIRSRTPIFEREPWIRAESHEIELPNGKLISDWVWIVTPDFVNVIAITEQEQFLCFRQNKYAVEGSSFAPVGGYIDQGETPLDAAKRELIEETGYEAEHWLDMGKFAADGNRGVGHGHLFMAIGARQTTKPSLDDLEEMTLFPLSEADFERELLNSQFKLLPWAACASLALLNWRRMRSRT
jgi:ADP-ribose pyrophosphatase